MAEIRPTDKPIYWAVENAGQVGLTGITEIGAVTQTAAGAWLEAGQIYGYNGGLVIVRQSHTRTEHAPADVPALFSVYRAGGGVQGWIANEPVLVGTHRTYDGVEYVCLQAHTTQTDWTPPAVPALWQVYTAPSANWAVGVAYKVGDVVTYTPDGKRYKCLQAHTSQAGWTPPAVPALWQVVG